jgi:hypothetical protein
MTAPSTSRNTYFANDSKLSDAAAKQCWIEHQTLQHVKEALRVTLAWKVSSVGAPRKLSTLQFMLRSFERHLSRLMDLEESGGYLADICDAKPRLWHRAFKLIDQHRSFRQALSDLAAALERVAPTNDADLNEMCDQITALLGQVDDHDSQEIEMIQEALLIDEGGEG